MAKQEENITLDSDMQFRKKNIGKLREVIKDIEEWQFFLDDKKKKIITPITTALNHLKQFEL